MEHQQRQTVWSMQTTDKISSGKGQNPNKFRVPPINSLIKFKVLPTQRTTRRKKIVIDWTFIICCWCSAGLGALIGNILARWIASSSPFKGKGVGRIRSSVISEKIREHKTHMISSQDLQNRRRAR